MKIVLDVPQNRVGFIMELLRSLSFIRVKPIADDISDEKALFLTELGESVEELNEVLAGRAKAGNAFDLLDEL
jgi:hypothetical protein